MRTITQDRKPIVMVKVQHPLFNVFLLKNTRKKKQKSGSGSSPRVGLATPICI